MTLLTGMFWFTGMLLPWDSLEYWLSRNGTGLTLKSLYLIHVLLLPLLLYPLSALYTRRTRTGGPPMEMPVSP